MSVPRRLGIGTPDSAMQSRTLQNSQRAILQQKIAADTLNQPMMQTNEDASMSTPSSPGYSRPASPGGYNTGQLHSPKPSPGVRVAVASPAPSHGQSAPNSYNVLPALERGHRYVITGTLQQSLFGVVKLAFDRQLKIQVAIKISRRERAAQQQTRSGVSVLENVRREAAVMRYMYQRSYAYSSPQAQSVESPLSKLAISQDFTNDSGKKVKMSSRALQHIKTLEEEKRKSVNLPNLGGGSYMEDDDKPHGVHLDSDTDTSVADSASDSDFDDRVSSPATPYASFLSNDPLDRAGEKYICRFIEELEDEYFHYLISEFVPAGDLYSMLTSYPSHRLSEQQARGIFRQMVLGMKYLHDRNIAHLDMSLENMCLDADDQIRIIDFGVAAIHPFTPTTFSAAMGYFSFPSASTPLPQQRPVNGQHVSPTKVFMCKPVKELYAKPGKIRYMSPELFQGLAWDAFANDIFSLGVILYSLLTGRPPFQQAESSDVWFHVIYSGQWLTPQIRKQPSAHVYTHLSESALDLVNRILKPQEVRPNCDAILQHPWMQAQ